MKLLITLLTLLFSQLSLAELVEYSVRDEDTGAETRTIFNYRNGNYRNTGEKLKFVFEVQGDDTLFLLEDFFVSIITKKTPYRHQNFQKWHGFPFITVEGVRGWVFIYYAGRTKENGYFYREEYWSEEGSLVMQTETVIDEHGILLSSVATNKEGETLKISKLGVK